MTILTDASCTTCFPGDNTEHLNESALLLCAMQETILESGENRLHAAVCELAMSGTVGMAIVCITDLSKWVAA